MSDPAPNNKGNVNNGPAPVGKEKTAYDALADLIRWGKGGKITGDAAVRITFSQGGLMDVFTEHNAKRD